LRDDEPRGRLWKEGAEPRSEKQVRFGGNI
jgi:hypothetical protein